MILKRYRAIFVGAIFTIVCILLYYATAGILMVMPLPLILDGFLRGLFPGEGYGFIGRAALISMVVIFSLITATFFYKFRRQTISNGQYETISVIAYLSLSLFIVHPLVFYVYLSKDWNRVKDGQFFFMLDETFLISSLSFVLLGILIDAWTQIILGKRFNR